MALVARAQVAGWPQARVSSYVNGVAVTSSPSGSVLRCRWQVGDRPSGTTQRPCQKGLPPSMPSPNVGKARSSETKPSWMVAQAGVLWEVLEQEVGKGARPVRPYICHVVYDQPPLTRPGGASNQKRRDYPGTATPPSRY